MMKDYHIGTLEASGLETLKNNAAAVEELPASRETFLVPDRWAKATLQTKTSLSRDTRLFTFALDSESQKFGLPVGQHVMMKLKDTSDTSKSIIRAYTPTSDPSDLGKVEVLVKVYDPTPTFPSGGKMTMAMDRIPIGTKVDFKGPIGKLQYLGKGEVLVNNEQRHVKRFYMICAGSGVTPIFQVLRSVMQDKDDTTRCTVLDGNRGEADILLRSEFDSFAIQNKGRCDIIHTLTQPPETWTGHKGRISEYLLKHYIAPPHKQSMVLVCGPEALEQSVRRMLLDQGWPESDLLFF
jgi:nitrate reductase (NAD(P)H)